ncbi:MAG: cob(I)yrinic acid a,c-diamide adenosyltransferase [Lachnospiraceae bacterium]
MSGLVQVYYGGGKGKSTAALGRAVRGVSQDGMNVFIIQFMKFRTSAEQEYLRRLEPEIKIFRFEKSDEDYTDLDDQEKLEEIQNIKNGINFAKKVLTTDEVDMLILDEILGLVDNKIISLEDLIALIKLKPDSMTLLLTGLKMVDGLYDFVDNVYNIKSEKGI